MQEVPGSIQVELVQHQEIKLGSDSEQILVTKDRITATEIRCANPTLSGEIVSSTYLNM